MTNTVDPRGRTDEQRPTTPREAIDRLTEWVGYLRISVQEPHHPGDPAVTADGEWVPATQLVYDPDVLYATMRTNTDAREIERDDIGMSLLIQSYAFRVASMAIGVWYASGGVLDISPSNVAIGFGRNRPNAVRLERAEWFATPQADHAATLPQLHQHLIDDHLAPIIENARRSCQVGERLMWSNVATGCASSFGALMGPLPDESTTIRARARRFGATGRPELEAGGEIVDIGPNWTWQRNACCLYYLDPQSSKCSDCSLHSPAERAARYAGLLAEVES